MPEEGFWLVESRDGVIQVTSCGQALCGAIVGTLDKPGQKPPQNWRGEPLCHFTIIHEMRRQPDGRWRGNITDPRDGSVYDALMWKAEDGTLRLRGFVFLPLFGSTQTWTPYPYTPPPDCRLASR